MLTLLTALVMAQGVPVPSLPSTTVGLLRYEQRAELPGFIFVVSAKTGELQWVKHALTQRAPGVPFRTLEPNADGSSLELTTADGQHVQLSLREKEQGSDWPAAVTLVKRGPKSLVVRLSIPNVGTTPLRLDPGSVAKGGSLENAVFHLRTKSGVIEYRGMMKKRAPPDPDEFIVVKPGAAYSVEVELGREYTLPPSGAVSVSFSTFNHFSPDEVTLSSNELVVE